MIVPVPYVHIGIGLTSILLAIPLIRRKVPMNRLYGVRGLGGIDRDSRSLFCRFCGGCPFCSG